MLTDLLTLRSVVVASLLMAVEIERSVGTVGVELV